MKKIFYLTLFLIIIIFISIINIFFKINSDFNHILGINLIFIMNLIIIILGIISIKVCFKKAKSQNSDNYKKFLKIAISNSFVASSIISILISIIIYGFSKNFFELFPIKAGTINYIDFASKIWFISSPFIGLELTIFYYFNEIQFFKTPIKMLFIKLVVFIALGGIFYLKYKTNCFVYAKPICDIILLPYYSKTCFGLTLK